MDRVVYNSKPIHIGEGRVFLDGIEVFDSVKCTIKCTPKVKTSKVIGDRTQNTRWAGVDYTGEITRRRSTSWLKDLLAKYISSGKTPEFTIQGVQEDKDSDFYADNGTDTVTAVGCVITSDINLLQLEADGEFLDDVLTFNIKDVILKTN